MALKSKEVWLSAELEVECLGFRIEEKLLLKSRELLRQLKLDP